MPIDIDDIEDNFIAEYEDLGLVSYHLQSQFDGIESLLELGESLSQLAEIFNGLAERGWALEQPITDGQVFLHKDGVDYQGGDGWEEEDEYDPEDDEYEEPFEEY
jgi:hypothetical protein